MGSAAPPPGKMDEKLKRKHARKSSFICLCYILRAIRTGRCGERRYAGHIFIHIYSDILQNAPFRSQIFKIFFASGGKGALTPLTKILRTFLVTVADICLSRALVYTAPTVSMQRSAVRNSQSLKKGLFGTSLSYS